MKCFYHSADLDGHCSGAIIKHRFPECELHPIDYKDEFPFYLIMPEDTIIMVDFSLRSIGQMSLVNQMCKGLIWIDHHKTAIEEYYRAVNEGMKPVKEACLHIGEAGCELAWDYCYPNWIMPLFVLLLGRYDVWDHQDSRTLPFQYAMRMYDTDPRQDQDGVWKRFFNVFRDKDKEAEIIGKLCTVGSGIMRYVNAHDKKEIGFGSFPVEINGHTALAINYGRLNYRDYDRDKYAFMVAFQRVQSKWRVNLYSDADKVDVGAIAREFGGGGHAGAAGFVCDELPFKI